MVPLVLIEVKILQCSDPVGLLCKFGPKVLLMHVCFLLLRLGCHPFAEVGIGSYNIVGLLAALITMRWGFKCQWSWLRMFALVLCYLVSGFASIFFTLPRHW